MSLRLPAAVNITSLELTVYDATASCTGPDASGGSALLTDSIALGVPTEITVSAGLRTFSVVAYDGSTAVARGCDRVDLVAGRSNTVTIQLVEYSATPDAGVPDAGIPDAMLPDATTPGEDCSAPITLAPDTPTTGTTSGTSDDLTGSCGGAGGDVVYRIDLASASKLTVTVDAPGAPVVASLRQSCGDVASELSCATAGAGDQTTLTVGNLPAGTYYVIVDSASAGGEGGFTITATVETPTAPTNDTCAAPGTVTPGTPSSHDLAGASDEYAGSCGGAGGGDAVFEITLASDARLRATVTRTSGTFDPVLHLRTVCGDDTSEVSGGCADASTGASEVLDVRSLAAGTYYLVVDAASGDGGGFDLLVETLPIPPGNDNCTAPIALTAGVPRAGDTSVGADDDESATCAGGGNTPDIVYSYTLAQARRVQLAVTTDFDAAVSVRGPNCEAEADQLVCEDAVVGAGTEAIEFRNQAAGTYYVIVDGVGGATGNVDVSLVTTAPPPAGDSCAEIETLNTGTTLNQTLGSPYADDSSASCGGTGGADRVYELTFFSDQQVDIQVTGNVDHALYLRSGSCEFGTELSCVTATDAGGGVFSSSFHADSLPGGTYYVYVDAASAGASGSFQITLTIQPPVVLPPNNTCSTPTTLALDTTTSGTLTNATDDAAGGCGGSGRGDVFYEFTLPQASRLRASVTRVSGTFDPIIYVRSVCNTAGSEIAGGCANDFAGPSEVIDIDNVAAGTYYLVVDSSSGTPGTFDVLVEALPVPPANDRCAGSIALSEGVSVSGTTVNAREDGAASCSAGGTEVFYQLTLTQRRRVVLDLTNSTVQHTISIQGICGDAQSEVECASTPATSESIEILDLAAGTYTVAVETETAGGGTFDLVYNTFPPVTNDTCTSPTTLTDGVSRSGDSTVGASDDETSSCGGAAAPDVIYAYTLTQARTVDLSVTSTHDTAVSIRSPNCTQELDESLCTNATSGAGTETINVRNQPAGTYYVVVDGVGGSTGTISDITLNTSPPPPAGDYCPEVVTLTEGSTTGVALSTSYANDDAGSCGGVGRERVYQFTFNGDKQVDIATSNATFAHAIYLRSTSCASGTEEGCATSTMAAGKHGATLSFNSLPGGTYFLFVDADPEASGTFDVDLTLSGAVTPPPNDACTAAASLIEGLADNGTLDGAMDDTATCTGGTIPDVFYALTLTETRSLIANLTSGSDTTLSLRASDCTTELACVNETATGEILDVGNLTAGTYYLVVEGSGGSFTVGYTTGAPRPVNDECGGETTLTDGVTLTGQTTTNALDDDLAVCGGTGGADVVYAFTIAANRRAKITVSNASGFDPVLYARSGSCTGTTIDCAQTSTGTSEVLDIPSLTPGTYYVWVDAAGAGTGTFDIRLDLLPEELPPAHDTCSAPDTLTEGVVAGPFSTVGAADDYDLTCLVGDSRDTVHQLTLASDSAVLATITPQTPGWNLAAALRADNMCTQSSDLVCVADRYPVTYVLDPNLSTGTYDIVIDGDSGAVGEYTIKYETRAADTTFGYWRIDSTGTYASIANTSGATQVSIPLKIIGSGTLGPGDEWSQPIAVPFAFDYYGSTFTSINAHSNGFLTFDTPPTGSAAYTNDCPLDSTAPTNTIALFWEDGISTDRGPSEMWTKLEGTAPDRRIVIEYKAWDFVYCQGPNCYVLDTQVNQQVVLYENGDIEMRYGPRQQSTTSRGCGTQHTGCSATLGIEGELAGGTDVDGAQCNTDGVNDGRVIYYVHPR